MEGTGPRCIDRVSGSKSSVTPESFINSTRVLCIRVVSGSVRAGPHLIMGDPLGLRDELSAAHFAVAVCEKPLVHLC